jgi:hypothetical protein
MKTALKVIGILLALAGAVWFLQGINILPGSYMTGNPQWAVNGAIAIVIGGGMYYLGNRRTQHGG